MIKITFLDNTSKEFPNGIKGIDIAKGISNRLAKETLSIMVNDEIYDLTRPIESNAKIKFFTWEDKEGKATFWHSSAHLMAEAVNDLFPDAKFGIGPDIDDGFYYDIDFGDRTISDRDFIRIENKMLEIAKNKNSYTRQEISKTDALNYFKKDNNDYKLELISELNDGDITLYESGNFIDLCKGPHLPDTSKIKAVKLLKVAGAYWRGDSDKPQLTRIYGVTFPKKTLLEEHLNLLEEAKKRDHRKIGKQLDLFSFHPEGPGFAFWHNKGMILKNTIINYWQAEHKKAGYLEINTPIMLDRSLWETSGHWKLYKDDMYVTLIDDKEFAIKPMNCPGGILLYKETPRTYRDLPLKMAELGLVHRHELSGTLHGLMRVRQFVQDDAHIYCTEEQLENEIIEVIELALKVLSTFKFNDYRISVSVRSEKKKNKYLGNDVLWDNAESALKNALDKKKLPFIILEGEAKFYGPSIDILIKDCLKREWQCTTLQLDFNLPHRFQLEYINNNNEKKTPIMLHRTVLGSLERFIGVLTEHFAGAFPIWLAPIQVMLLPISTDKHLKYSKQVKEQLNKNNIKVEMDDTSETLNKKVRNAELQKIPYIIIIGDKEVESNSLSVRSYETKKTTNYTRVDFLNKIINEIEDKK
jgi:threonyl-tRNA synthetase